MHSTPRLLLMVSLIAVSGCRCDGGPATGQCSGTWGGVDVSAQIDPTSRYVVIYPETCAGVTLRLYEVSFGGAQLQLDFEPTQRPSILSEKTLAVPAGFTAFKVEPAPAEVSGSMTLGITGIFTRRTGAIELNAGAESLSCSFELPLEFQGTKPSCGSSGGSSHDWDD